MKVNLCSKCIGEKTFSDWVKSSAIGKCDFDESHGGNNKIVSVESLAIEVDRHFRENYQVGGEYISYFTKSDNPRYEQYGRSLEMILDEDFQLGDNNDLLQDIIDNLPDNSHYEIKDGGEPFYSSDFSYELIEDARNRDLMEYDDAMRDYEIDAILDNKNPFNNLYNELDSLSRLLDENISQDLQKHQFMMIFTFAITVLETYLSDRFMNLVSKNKKLQIKYLKSEPNLKKEKILLSEIFSEYKNIDSKIKERIQETIFHNLGRVRILYYTVLNVNLENMLILEESVNKRHDLVHRGGKDKNKNDISVDKNEVQSLISEIKKVADKIEKQLEQ